MPDAEAKLKVVIESAAQTGGFDDAASAATRLRQQTEGLKTSGDPLEDFAASATGLADKLDRDTDGLLEFAQGASSVTKPLADVAGNASSAGSATEKLGQIFGGLSRAGQGGKEGVMGVVMACRALVSLGTGPVGFIVGLVAAAAGLAIAFANTGESAEKAKQKIDELNQAKLDEAVKQQEAYKRAAEDTLRTLQAEAAAREEIADYELARRKAAVRADAKTSGESAEVTEQKLVALDRQREDEKRANALKLANDEAELRAKTQKDLEAAQKKAQQEIADAEARRAAVTTAEQKLAATAPESTSGSYGMSLNGDPARQKALADLEAAREAARMDTDEKIKGLKADAATKKTDAEAAARAAAQAKAAADLLAKTKQKTDPLLAATRGDEDRANRPETEAEKAKREAAQAKARSRAESTVDNFGLEVWKNRAAGGQVDDITLDVLKKRYPKAKFTTPSTTTAPLTPTSVDAAQQPTASNPGTMVGPDGRVHTATATTAGGGTMVGPDGRVFQVPAGGTVTAGGGTGIGPDGRPWTFPAGNGASTLTMGGQTFTGGAGGLKPTGQGSSDNKTAEALKGTTAAVKEQDTGKDTAKEAEALKKAAEEQSKAQQQAQAATKQALGAAKEVMSALTTTTNRHTSEIAMLRSQISAMRSRA